MTIAAPEHTPDPRPWSIADPSLHRTDDAPHEPSGIRRSVLAYLQTAPGHPTEAGAIMHTANLVGERPHRVGRANDEAKKAAQHQARHQVSGAVHVTMPADWAGYR